MVPCGDGAAALVSPIRHKRPKLKEKIDAARALLA